MGFDYNKLSWFCNIGIIVSYDLKVAKFKVFYYSHEMSRKSSRKEIVQDLPFNTNELARPLAERIRPHSIDDIFGQSHLLGESGLIRRMVGSKNVRSMILWGPPGTGKTTIASIMADSMDADYIELNAISSGVKELREAIENAGNSLAVGTRTILFIDEIHRFNKAQQASLLKSVEEGTVILIGATTENPSFEVIGPLLSRCHIFTLYPLGHDELDLILKRAFGNDVVLKELTIEEDAADELKRLSGGDARVMLNALEVASGICRENQQSLIDNKIIKEAYQTQHYRYDQTGEEHYNTISAFIKSVRGSDPDAAVYYLARMLEAGEDPKFIARRLIILASEDIGNAEPYALTLTTNCFTAVNYIGMPEARIILSQTTTFLASCPKSNSSYVAIDKALKDVRSRTDIQIPVHLRNAPTKMMKEMEYGKGYKYSHSYSGNFTEQEFLPVELSDRIYYEPTDNGKESRLKKYLKEKWKKRR